MKSTNYITKTSPARKLLGIAGALLILLVPLLLLQHADKIEYEQSLCPFKLLTGLPCPGCGITKSIIFFYKGDLLKSLYYHLFGPFVIVFCMVTVVVLSAELATSKTYFRHLLFNKKLAYALGIILGSYHFIRLIHFVATHSLSQVLKESIWM